MKKILLILVGIVVLIYFVVYSDNKEGFDLNIKIGFEKDPPKPPKRPKPRGVRISPSRPAEQIPDEYNYPKGVKNPSPDYQPLLNSINTQMPRAANDDGYGGSADTGIERGS